MKKILVPLDGSQASETALACAAWLAARTGAEVTLLHVIEQVAHPRIHGDRHLVDAGEAADYLNEVAASLLPQGVAHRIHVHDEATNHVAASIASHEVEFGTDLLVISPHGPAGWRAWLAGNIPQRVVKRVVTPVLIARSVPVGEAGFGKVLIPDDASPVHDGEWEVCFDIARAGGTGVELLTVVETTDTLGGVGAATAAFLPRSTDLVLELLEAEARQHLDGHVEQFRLQNIKAVAEIRRGDPFSVLCSAIAEMRPGLVVLRTHRRAGMEAWFSGSLTSRLLHQIGTSVLLMPL
ncbi:MAG: universal stress protein [Terrimicrobiaceae bacterium]